MKLGQRLFFAFTAVTAVALAASFVAVFLLVRRDEIGDLDRALFAQARLTANLIEQNGTSELDGAVAVPEHFDPLPRYVAVYAPNGAVMASAATFVGGAPALANFGISTPVLEPSTVDLRVGADELRGVVLPISGSRSLLYAASRREVTADERFLFPVLGILFVSALGATALVASFLGRRFSRDTDTLAAVARRVADGDLAARIGKPTGGSTEMRALASDIDSMIERLSALVLVQRTFISHAAHELRSPLATLRGELQLALRRQRTTDEYVVTLEGLLGEVEGLVLLTEDLLTLARVQGTEPKHSAAPVGEVIREALRMARGRAEIKGVRLEPPARSSSAVRGSIPDLARALRNLIDNAITHAPTGSVVKIEVTTRDEVVSVNVTDQGSGVAALEEDRLFSPFFRGANATLTEEPGAGLGLAIARGIARSHGGDVRFVHDSHPTRFVLELAGADGPTDSARSQSLGGHPETPPESES